ncbi:MAG: acyl-CoA mutase large subunit family protein, partial [Leptospiraceae bacterium]|nr:acyl-CoA mutase large subunit family protein [Leptospiraceae bacterium]
WRTGEGFAVRPYYRKADGANDSVDALPGEFPYVRGNRRIDNRWEIRQEIDAGSVATANNFARRALDGGAGAVEFVSIVRPDAPETVQGVPIQSYDDFKQVLQGLDLTGAQIHWRAGWNAPVLLAYLSAYAAEQNLDAARIRSHLHFDPAGMLISTGKLPVTYGESMRLAADMIRFAADRLPGVRVLAISGRPYHEGGAGLVEELAIMLATGAEYLHVLTEAGLDLATITRQMHFEISVGPDYFLEMARLRAARQLWAGIVREFQKNAPGGSGSASESGSSVEAGRMLLHARTSGRYHTLYDAHTNMLRVTTAAMSAVIGGCESLTVLPFNRHTADDEHMLAFGLRIARNTQSLLKHESYLDKVVDPAAGAYYIEQATAEITRESWKRFQAIEAEGGLLSALKTGSIQGQIEQSRSRAEEAVANRRLILLGTNQYPDTSNRILDKGSDRGIPETELKQSSGKFQSDPAKGDWIVKLSEQTADVSAVLKNLQQSTGESVTAIPTRRLGADFEELRLQTEHHAQSKGRTPRVYLLLTGNVAMRRARAGFAFNFYGCAGYEIEEGQIIEGVQGNAEAAINSGADVIVLCAGDDDYAAQGAEITRAIKSLKAGVQVMVAGN